MEFFRKLFSTVVFRRPVINSWHFQRPMGLASLVERFFSLISKNVLCLLWFGMFYFCLFFFYLFALFNSRRTFFVDKVLGVVDKSIHLRCLYHRSNSYVKAQRWCVENRLIVSEWAYLIICGCAKCYFPVDWSLRMRESAFLSSIYFTFFSLCFVCLQRRCHTIYQSIELISLQIKERKKIKLISNWFHSRFFCFFSIQIFIDGFLGINGP